MADPDLTPPKVKGETVSKPQGPNDTAPVRRKDPALVNNHSFLARGMGWDEEIAVWSHFSRSDPEIAFEKQLRCTIAQARSGPHLRGCGR